MLQKQKSLVEVYKQQKYSELLGYAENVKKSHKDSKDSKDAEWKCEDDKTCTIKFDFETGEDGVFTKTAIKKDENKDKK